MRKKYLSKALAFVLALAMAMSLAACGVTNGGNADGTSGGLPIEVATQPPAAEDNAQGSGEDNPAPAAATYAREDDEEVYERALSRYSELAAAAKAELTDMDLRFVLFAQAEAELLDSAVMIPNTTRGGAYQISRIAPRTIPYVQWGNDDDRLFGLVISDEFLTPEERADLLAQWNAAVAGEGEYDPIAYLEGKGHTIQHSYTTTFTTAPVTLDWLNTSSQSDTELTVNCVDGLVQYDNLSRMQPALAESWDISDDGTVYTFHIRPGVYWYTSDGTQYAEVTADDFEAGFHHMLDTHAGLEWLIDDIVVGGTDYYTGNGTWEDVGYKATDTYELTITLEQPVPYFMTMLTYSCFLPICKSFYESHGGVYGLQEYADAFADTNTYTYGKNTDVASQVYCGPFLLRSFNKDSEFTIVKNENHYNADKVNLDTIRWVFDTGENPTAVYNDTLAGVYAGTSLVESTGTLALAKADGNFDKYAYVSDTESTSYFGGLNLNRGTFALESGAVASPKTEQQKIDTHTAMQNKSFRQAVQFAFDKGSVNAVTRGEDLKYTNLRNMYTHPEFVSLTNDITVDGHTFEAGTFYGELVQYYLDQMGSPIQVADQIDGWYHPEEARAALAQAKEELGGTVTWPITIDVVYQSNDEWNTAQAQAYKQVVENTLGADSVTVNLVEATTREDYYASGYRATNGEAGNFDMFYGSGWGPDYGDPSTYLDTFRGEGAGYMTKVIGLF